MIAVLSQFESVPDPLPCIFDLDRSVLLIEQRDKVLDKACEKPDIIQRGDMILSSIIHTVPEKIIFSDR
jgi:hypothetical protein